MTRLSISLTLLCMLCLLVPQIASAAPSLDWNGKVQMMNGFAQEDEDDDEYEEDDEDDEDDSEASEDAVEQEEAEQAAPTAAPVRHNDEDEQVARNIVHGTKGGLYLGIGIPLGVLGTALTIGGFANVVNAAVIAGFYGPEGGGAIYAAAPAIGGVILLSLGIPALVTGILLIRKGMQALNKISDYSLSEPDTRMARAEQNRARWGMQFAMATLP